MHSTTNDRLPVRQEIYRKLIHLASSAVPIAYQFWLTREQTLLICSMIIAVLLGGEVVRRTWKQGSLLFRKFFGSLLRDDEKHKLTGATYLYLSATITVFLFEKSVAVPAILTLTVSDSMAAIIGKSVGRYKIFGKTLEGSVAFFATTIIIFYLYFGSLSLYLIITAALISLLELIPLRFNDNPVVSLASALLLMIGRRS
jgi:dolichol kinase